MHESDGIMHFTVHEQPYTGTENAPISAAEILLDRVLERWESLRPHAKADEAWYRGEPNGEPSQSSAALIPRNLLLTGQLASQLAAYVEIDPSKFES